MSDPRTLADALDELSTDWEQRNTDDLRAAAALLRRHADLLDAIGDPDELRAMVRSLGLNSIEEDRTLTKRVADIADAVDGPT